MVFGIAARQLAVPAAETGLRRSTSVTKTAMTYPRGPVSEQFRRAGVISPIERSLVSRAGFAAVVNSAVAEHVEEEKMFCYQCEQTKQVC